MNKTTTTPRTALAALNEIDRTEYVTDEDGIMQNRSNLNITATLSYESEDYIRIIKTLADLPPVYMRALRGTYDEEQARARFIEFRSIFESLRDHISKDMGYCMADRLEQWQGDYI